MAPYKPRFKLCKFFALDLITVHPNFSALEKKSRKVIGCRVNLTVRSEVTEKRGKNNNEMSRRHSQIPEIRVVSN